MKPVKSEPGRNPIVVDAYLDAPISSVYHAFTDPTIISQWFGPKPNSLHSATVDLRVGGAWCFVESSSGGQSSGFEGEYLEIEPNARLAFTWSKFTTTARGQHERTHPSRVDISLRTSGTGTQLRVAHTAIDSDAMRDGFARGWARGVQNLQRAVRGH